MLTFTPELIEPLQSSLQSSSPSPAFYRTHDYPTRSPKWLISFGRSDRWGPTSCSLSRSCLQTSTAGLQSTTIACRSVRSFVSYWRPVLTTRRWQSSTRFEVRVDRYSLDPVRVVRVHILFPKLDTDGDIQRTWRETQPHLLGYRCVFVHLASPPVPTDRQVSPMKSSKCSTKASHF